LTDLKAQIKTEGEEEAKTYDKFACFCKDTTKTKSDAIEEGQDKVDQLTADIADKTATRKEKISDRAKEQQKVEDTTKKLKETTEQYLEDKQKYEETNADLTKAVNSARRAHSALSGSKGAAFIDLGTKSDVRNCLDLAEALGMVPTSKHEAMTAFLQVDPNDPAYKFHSDKILEIIKDLQTDFAEERTKVQDEWKKTDKAYKDEKKEMEDIIETAKDKIETLDGEISDLKEQIAQHKEDLINTEATLKDDSDYLRDLTMRCEEKGRAWDQRTSIRNDEVEALTKAMTILKEQASNADDVNKRAMLLVKKPAPVAPAPVPKVAAKASASKAPAKTAKTQPAHVEKKDKPKAKNSLSFLQTRSQKMQDQTVAFLRHESARLGSNMLASVAMQIEKDPFVKIKKLIQGLIERLLEESKAEATKKGFCDTELGKSYEDRKNRLADVNKLDTEIESLEAHQKALEQEIEELEDALVNLRDTLKETTELRKEEKAENEETMQKAKEGAAAVGEALTILKDFYKSAAKEKLFLQVSASPVDEDDPGAGFDSAYRGGQSSSKGILGLLEVIKTDYERTHRQTEAAEKAAHEEFIKFERTSKSDIGAKDTKRELDEQDLASTKSARSQSMKDLQTATDLLDKALENIEELKPTCIDTGMSYAERVEKREEEIKALKEALEKLQPK
jgi:chromosome segregation ATPase